jgi:DNA-binding transcriptional ArsR family regulator
MEQVLEITIPFGSAATARASAPPSIPDTGLGNLFSFVITILDVDNNIDSFFPALADPTRRRVVELLGDRAYRAGELAQIAGTSAPVMSRHLRILLEAGFVADERVPDDARLRVFHLRREPVLALQAWLDQLQAHWNEQLGAFKRYVEEQDQT